MAVEDAAHCAGPICRIRLSNNWAHKKAPAARWELDGGSGYPAGNEERRFCLLEQHREDSTTHTTIILLRYQTPKRIWKVYGLETNS